MESIYAEKCCREGDKKRYAKELAGAAYRAVATWLQI